MVSPDLPVFDSTDAAIKLLEEERRRISRDLHDGPAQGLTNISMRLDIMQTLLQTNPDMAISELNRINSRVVSVINELRRLIYDLRPVAIDEVGLISATLEMTRSIERDTDMSFQVDIAPDVKDDISPAKQVAIYRLIQEIFNNMKKHAEASLITLRFARQAGEMVITIRDNGIGFDPTVIPAGHYGMIGMKERASLLGGSLEIHSEIGSGSAFTIRVPVYKGNEYV